MRGAGDILLVSTYELGHAPQGVAWPMAFLERAGFAPAALDLAVEPFDLEKVRRARLVALSVPMHTALRLGLAAAARIRSENPEAVLCFHGLYAPLNAPLLLAAGARAVLGGECEPELVALAEALERSEPSERMPGSPGRFERFVMRRGADAPVLRLDYPVPSRRGLPPPARYARLDPGAGDERLAGYAETTRGCKHLCRHCPLPAVYAGRFVAVPAEVVLADVAAQVEAGVQHVTFGDPDFLNGPTHALRIARALHARFPALTFDFTAKVEHLVADPAVVRELASLGALFVTSAVESFSDEVLLRLAKGHTRGDALAAFDLCAAAGLALRPSFMPFTPWETLDGYLDLLETLEARGWLPQVDPVQLSIRLLVPPGSLLEHDTSLGLEGLDEAALTYRWRHPDPRMDALQRRVSAAVEEAAAAREEPPDTHAKVKAVALAVAGRPHEHVPRLPPDRRRAPRLTETWFC